MNTEPTVDKQVVEVLGRNRLIEILLRDCVEVAIPMRDKGIDLVAYFCVGARNSRFVAVPIQMKAASTSSFVLDKKYAQSPGLFLAYVWHVNDSEETEIFLLTYTEALQVLRQRKHDRTKSWREDGKYSITNPGWQLREALAPFKVGRGEFRRRLKKNRSDANADAARLNSKTREA